MFQSIFTYGLLVIATVFLGHCDALDKKALKQQAYEMFMHGYRSYMDYAYPADELMPLSCKGRVRGVTPSRGDVDDSLGNFSLTLIDALDTLVVLSEFDEFEKAVDLIINNVRFDSDHVVSVFETNIRVLGGLVSGHLMSELVKGKFPDRMKNYNGQLLKMAVDVGDRLLPAFNTSSGLPFSRINLRYGMLEHLKRQRDTCTACGGTMLLEMAALSRLTGNPVYELKARKAMDFLWAQRHRSSDLMGTVLNVHSGDWVRRESGIGAGIDSYYEYCLKAYILLGDRNYLERFNRHYDAIMRYVNKGPLFVDVHMHRPTVATRGFMDSLLAFWPGLQVLKGDVPQAIEMHEMLFQVIQKHKFLPEAFTHDFQVHWGEHPLRPEFVESTYFLYRATRDPHYLEVAKQVMDSINEYVRVPCGFASIKDVRTMSKEDQMESFVLSETFKYLYMIFAEPSDIIFDPDNYVLTTEAHFLPLSMGQEQNDDQFSAPRKMFLRPDETTNKNYVCANPMDFGRMPTEREEALLIRQRTQIILNELKALQAARDGASDKRQCETQQERLRAWAFSVNNQEHVKQLNSMGIEIIHQEDGRFYLSHQVANAKSPKFGLWGGEFMQEMMQLIQKMEKQGKTSNENAERYLQITSSPYFGKPFIMASPAQFGTDLTGWPVESGVAVASPFKACTEITNDKEVRGRIAIVERSECMFQEKARHVQKAGAIGLIVIDHEKGTQSEGQLSFAMAGDKDSQDDIAIPAVFLYRKEGEMLLRALEKNKKVVVRMAADVVLTDLYVEEMLKIGVSRLAPPMPKCPPEDGDFIFVDHEIPAVTFNVRLGSVKQDSDPTMHQDIVERHVTHLQEAVEFDLDSYRNAFFALFRTAAYGALGLNVENEKLTAVEAALRNVRLLPTPREAELFLKGDITQIRCVPRETNMECTAMWR